jgi:hypothetical protein
MKKRVIRLTETDIKNIVRRVISEQNAPVKNAVKGYDDLKSAVGGPGTNEKNLLNVFSTIITNKADFDKLNAELQKNPYVGQELFTGRGYSSILDVLNGELELGDYQAANTLKNNLAKIGVNISFEGVKNVNRPQDGFVSVKPNSFKIGDGVPKEGGTTSSVIDTVGSVLPGVTKSSVSGVEAALKQFPNSRVQFIIDPKTGAQRYFQSTKDGSKMTGKGNWSIQNGKMTYQKDGNSATPQIGNVRVAPTEDAVKSGTAFVESTMSGELVKKIQQALISQGFLKITKPTSYFGSKTDVAIKEFQKAKGLKVDGKVGKNTYVALFSATTPEADKRVSQEILNIQPKGLANVTQGIQTPPQITRQGNIQPANY